MTPVFCGVSFSQVPPFLRERYLENYERLFNGKWKLSNPNATQWQQHITAIDNGARATEGRIYTNRYYTNRYYTNRYYTNRYYTNRYYTNRYYTNRYDKIYTNGYAYFYKVVEL
jgi:hypothetical protein